MKNTQINCRARIANGCLNGKPVDFIYDDDNPVSGDGTYRVIAGCGTVICDACYVALYPYTPSGRGLLHELDDAIKAARERKTAR